MFPAADEAARGARPRPNSGPDEGGFSSDVGSAMYVLSRYVRYSHCTQVGEIRRDVFLKMRNCLSEVKFFLKMRNCRSPIRTMRFDIQSELGGTLFVEWVILVGRTET